MIKRLLLGASISLLVVILPLLGNGEILRALHIRVMIVFAFLASIFQPAYNPVTIAARRDDRGTGAQIIWSVYITQLAAILECAYMRYPESVEWDIAAIAALVFMSLGLALRTWAVVALGDFFTMHLAIQEKHTVIRRGPYSIVRHPSYLGAFILYSSTTLFLHAWFSLVFALPALTLAFLRRIYYEEEMLKKEFGDVYKTYQSQVKKCIPWVW